MVWVQGRKYKPEVRKCRKRLIRFCVGSGLDLGCGEEKIKRDAIGIDGPDIEGADLGADLSKGLPIFRDRSFDFVFSSHCLEDMEDTKGILSEWWRVIKVGGYLVLYLPHKALYPNIGGGIGNPHHKHDFIPGDIIKVMNEIHASYELMHHETRDQKDEYSFDIVFRKLATDGIKNPIQIGSNTYAKNYRSCLVIRYGAFGDHIVATAALPILKEQGYRVTYNGTQRSLAILANNPNIDEFWMQEQNVIDPNNLGEYFETLGDGFDKVVNFTHAIEGKMLFLPNTKEYNMTTEERQKLASGRNYYRYAVELVGGDPDEGMPVGKLYPTPIEEGMCRLFAERYRDKFIILWCLSGSAIHKAYPYTYGICETLFHVYDDIVVVTVGDYACKLLEWDHERLIRQAGKLDIRSTLLLTKYVQLVISPETAVLNAAGCYDTPKIGFLTHSSKENLTSTFANDHSMQADIECSPCHRMVYVETMKDCPRLLNIGGEELPFSACAGAFNVEKVITEIEKVYHAWHISRNTVPRIRPTLTQPTRGPAGWTSILRPERFAL